jgi:hypothetical protein
MENNGRMAEVYTDRDSMFVVAPRPGESEPERRQADRVTPIGRALRELGIGWTPRRRLMLHTATPAHVAK